MSDNMNLTQWIEAYDLGHFDDPSLDTQCDAGWYDWFCKSSSLAGKTKALGRKVKQICKLFDQEFLDTHYVFFKNNCPMNGRLYDSFSICEIRSGDVVYWVTPKLGYYNENFEKAELAGRENKFEDSLYLGDWKGLVEYLKQSLGRQ